MEDFAGLGRGADDALGDEIEETGDVLEARGRRGARPEDASYLWARNTYSKS